MFEPRVFYQTYPQKVMLRPGYPARAQYKSQLLWRLYGNEILMSIGKIKTYADIGGCFGFGANSMAYNINRSQGEYPETKVFEISKDFINTGKMLFPYIEFINEDFQTWSKNSCVFDLITMLDVIEHIPDILPFLSVVANRTHFALIKTPLETGGEFFGAKPPLKQGNEHEEGHVNFFTPNSYLDLLKKSGFKLVKGKVISSIIPLGAEEILNPESKSKLALAKTHLHKIIPCSLSRKFYGNCEHIGLFKSETFV